MTTNQLMLDLVDGQHTIWHVTKKTDVSCRQLADRHYSRQTVGATNFCRPGNNYVLRTVEGDAVWVSWYSKYRDDKFEAIECTLFRNESAHLSSELILLASLMTFKHFGVDVPQTIITYVKGDSVASTNAGYCYLKAGYKKLNHKSSKGLLTFAITYDELIEIIHQKTRKSEWFKGIEGQLKDINDLHEQMNEAFAEYEFDLAVMYASEAAEKYKAIRTQLEGLFMPEFTEASSLLKMYCHYFFEEAVNINDLYETLIEWQTIEGTEELQAAVELLELQYRDLSGFITNNHRFAWTNEVSPHLLNWIDLEDFEMHV